jgi:hypothetical protein
MRSRFKWNVTGPIPGAGRSVIGDRAVASFPDGIAPRGPIAYVAVGVGIDDIERGARIMR